MTATIRINRNSYGRDIDARDAAETLWQNLQGLSDMPEIEPRYDEIILTVKNADLPSAAMILLGMGWI